MHNEIEKELTKRRPLNTDKPSTSSNMRSRRLADTMIRSNMFHPQAKKSLLIAMTFIIHSRVNIDVNT